MSGYTPLYDTLLTGTLYGKWPHVGVWACLLSRVSRDGEIDERPEMLAAMMGIEVGVLLQCIHDFMQPDPGSRTAAHEGRRLALIDPQRDWGWKVLNSTKYKEKARKQAYDKVRTESGADAARKAEERASKNSPAMSRDVPLSESESESENKDRADRDLVNPKSDRPPDRTTESATQISKSGSPVFAEIRKIYPKRSGSQRWQDAESAFKARVREGHSPEKILEGVNRYAEYVRAEGNEGSSFVQQAATFLGANRGFLEDWKPGKRLNGSHGHERNRVVV